MTFAVYAAAVAVLVFGVALVPPPRQNSVCSTQIENVVATWKIN
eukprot:COSAG01_NODE_62638_length_283_cov_1.418478_1_plen_43_part_01